MYLWNCSANKLDNVLSERFFPIALLVVNVWLRHIPFVGLTRACK